jgi:SAM-dependent methyltransferase
MALLTTSARDSYEQMAPFYDRFTADHDYDGWTERLERLALDHGCRGNRLLDVGCGTGKSFVPMLARGYEVVASDIAPAMAAEARRKAPGVPVHVCDVRALPTLGAFDLVWSLDDCLNHLLDADALRLALARLARNLAPSGVLLFDLNTLATYRGFFASTTVIESDDHVLIWSGRTAANAPPDVLARASLTSFSSSDGDAWRRVCCTHVQRHHPEEQVRAAIAAAGLDCVAVYGHGLDGLAHAGVDEATDTKAVYLARHAR